MPRPRPPPTPGSSTDITAQENKHTTSMEGVFTLPPAAVTSPAQVKQGPKALSRAATLQNSPPSSPDDKGASAATQRKRTLSGSAKAKAEASQALKDTLPPPPSRTRKIIQMKPKQSPMMPAQDQPTPTLATPSTGSKQGAGKKSKAQTQSQSGTAPPATSNRKIARKTAHSIIERRRRFKMNEEFGVLKDMVPACEGVEMHKLAILQAGIEYLKYLEGCMTSLKKRNAELEQLVSEGAQERAHSTDETRKYSPRTQQDDQHDTEDQSMDVDGEDTEFRPSRPASTALTEDSASVSVASSNRPMQLNNSHYDRYRLQHGQDVRGGSIMTGTTNSTYASPDLRPIKSSASLANSIGRQTSSNYPRTSQQPQQQPQPFGSQYSVLPPLTQSRSRSGSISHYSHAQPPLSQAQQSQTLPQSPSYTGSPYLTRQPTTPCYSPAMTPLPPTGLPELTTSHSSTALSTHNAAASMPTPTNTGISPFIHAFHFSPDLTRTSTTTASSYAISTPGSSTFPHNTGHGVFNPSPKILPLPQAALPLPHGSSSGPTGVLSGGAVVVGTDEATATAALMMMGHDRRGSVSLQSNSNGLHHEHHHYQHQPPIPSHHNQQQQHRQQHQQQHHSRANTQSSDSNPSQSPHHHHHHDEQTNTPPKAKTIITKGMSVRDLLSN